MREMTTAVILGYLAIMNVIAFAAMGVDKSRAKRGAWRIPEKTLFSLSLLGGSIGALAGMYTFRHKTKHLKFVAPLHKCRWDMSQMEKFRCQNVVLC